MVRARRKLQHLAAGVAFALPAAIAVAQPYPARPVTMVVPYPAGGLFDSIARILGEHLGKTLAQPVVIENVGGAGGSIAVGRVARAAPDGHTVAIGSEDHFVVNAAVYPLSYDVVNDLDPVTLLTTSSLLIVGRKDLPANGLKGLLAWLKANQASVAFAHNGAGGLLHRCGLALQRAADASWPFVTYRGAAPALQDVAGGRIDVMCAAPTALTMIRGGLVRAYAVTGAARLAAAPDIPTADESSVADLRLSGWGAVFVPKGTPKRVIATLRSAFADALADPDVRRKLTGFGQDIVVPEHQTPDALAALQKAEIEKWWPIIKAANIKAE